MSAYMILEQETGGGDRPASWLERGIYSEPSAASAVRAYVQHSKSEGGVFLAIPERSAKTIRVKVETVQKVSVDAGEGEAS
jgi:hypothetical protein